MVDAFDALSQRSSETSLSSFNVYHEWCGAFARPHGPLRTLDELCGEPVAVPQDSAPRTWGQGQGVSRMCVNRDYSFILAVSGAAFGSCLHFLLLGKAWEEDGSSSGSWLAPPRRGAVRALSVGGEYFDVFSC